MPALGARTFIHSGRRGRSATGWERSIEASLVGENGRTAWLYVTLGVFLAALVLARVLPRGLLATAVLVVPVAWTINATVSHDLTKLRRDADLTPVEATVVPPIRWAGYRNVPLLVAAKRLVPADATITFLPGGRWRAQGRDAYLQSGWVRWVAFVLAPRLVVDTPKADWLILVDQTPAQVGVRPRAAWRFGQDWLVKT